MAFINLTDVFDREIEVLEAGADSMIYAIDRKDETKNKCVIERYDFKSKTITTLLPLDYTRLYESFHTYGQHDAFFYAVNVLDDYRVRLRKIYKKTWEIGEDILLNAEGEVLSLYILDDDHLLVTDEAEASEKYVSGWGMAAGSRYMNLCYVYDIKNGRKYPVKDERFHELLETVKTYDVCGRRVTMCIPKDEAVLEADTSCLLEALKAGKTLPLKAVFEAQEGKHIAFAEDGSLGFYGRVYGNGTEEIFFFGADTKCRRLCGYAYDEDGEYFYYPAEGHVFYSNGRTDENGRKHLACMMDSMISLTIGEDFGDFTGICTDEAFVTAFYKEVLVKEDIEFREYAAVCFCDGRPAEIFAGRCIYGGGNILLLKSFLAL